jgi:LacI family transcriptional regulator
MGPTIRDVAQKANVSISTVSRVVNNPLAVRKEKRDRVLVAIKELGYEPNPFASGLRDKRSMTIGAIIPDISNPFFAALLRGIEDVARENRNNVIICNSDQDGSRFKEYMHFFYKKRVDGIIFVSESITPNHFECFQKVNAPVVLAATESLMYDHPFVKVDDYRASFDGTQFLIKNGHRNIGMISGSISDPIAGRPRFAGFENAMNENGLLLQKEQVVFGDLKYDSGYQAMGKLIAKTPDITAVFAASDEMAMGAISFLTERGIEVPQDVSVLGFDNIPAARMIRPGLTTVAQPIYEIGHKSASALFQWVNTGVKPDSIMLDHEIIVRDTVIRKKTESLV